MDSLRFWNISMETHAIILLPFGLGVIDSYNLRRAGGVTVMVGLQQRS